MAQSTVWEHVVIGSGFAGAAVACRLVEAGQKVLLIERGKRYGPQDFPVYPSAAASHDRRDWHAGYRPAEDFSRLLWNTQRGLLEVRDLDALLVLQAAGFGGGSLIYANVHLRPPDEVFDHHWPDGYDADSLAPYFDRAASMLGVQPIPAHRMPRKGRELRRIFEECAEDDSSFVPLSLPLAVAWSESDIPQEDLGAGLREPCDLRGDCMFGCPRGAKNSLDWNYLRIVERSDFATVKLMTEVLHIQDLVEGPGQYRLTLRDHLMETNERVDAVNVFLCAGAVNTTELLMRYRDSRAGAGASVASKVRNDTDTALANVGRRLFANNDGIAAVFGTCAPQDADVGPTISSGGLYRKLGAEHDPIAATLIRIVLRSSGSRRWRPMPGDVLMISLGTEVLRIVSVEDGIWAAPHHGGDGDGTLHTLLASADVSDELPDAEIEGLVARLNEGADVVSTTGRLGTVRHLSDEAPARTDGREWTLKIVLDAPPPRRLPRRVVLRPIQGRKGAAHVEVDLHDLQVDPLGVFQRGVKPGQHTGTIVLGEADAGTLPSELEGLQVYGLEAHRRKDDENDRLRIVAATPVPARSGLLTVRATSSRAFHLGEVLTLVALSGRDKPVSARHEVRISTPPLRIGDDHDGTRWTLEIAPGPGPGRYAVEAPGDPIAVLAYRAPQTWLMIQEGGVPQTMAPFMGLFRSPLLLGRNRHRHDGPEDLDPEANEARLEALRGEDYATLPFADLIALVADLPGAGLDVPPGVSRLITDPLPYAQLRSGPTMRLSPTGDQRPPWSAIPTRLKDNLSQERLALTERVSRSLVPLLEGFLVETSQRLNRKLKVEDLLEEIAGKGCTRRWLPALGRLESVDTDLVMALIQLVIQLGWNNQARLISELSRFAIDRVLPSEGRDYGTLINGLIAWALDHRIPSRHDTLCLVMGRDSQPFGLHLDTALEHDRFFSGLRAVGVDPLLARDAVDREQLLRALNGRSRWQGDLRLDPLGALLDLSVSVHPQGGCAMGRDAASSVTCPEGRVHGQQGLYVMDAAAFPVSVGVNPSATILAVAERKVERFIQRLLALEGRSATFSSGTVDALRGTPLDPLNLRRDPVVSSSQRRCVTIPSEVGIQFEEALSGYFTVVECKDAAVDSGAEREEQRFEAAEHAGFESESRISLAITVTVPSVERFIRAQERSAIVYAPLCGTVTLESPHVSDGAARTFEIEKSSSHVRYDLGTGRRRRPGTGVASLRYAIRGVLDGDAIAIDGTKIIDNDEGLDLWSDITSLMLEMRYQSRCFEGMVRQSIEDFLSTTNPSMRAIGTRDPVVETWAIARYSGFFLRMLARHYSPVSLRRLRRMLGMRIAPGSSRGA